MSFASSIAAPFGKRPVWLYRINVDGTVYHLTSRGSGYTTPNDRPSTEFPTGQVWTSAAIVRGEIFQTSKSNQNDTWLRMPTVSAAMTAIRASEEYNNITVDIWQGFAEDADNEFVLRFSGRVVSVKTDILLTTVVLETALSGAARSSLAQVVQRLCRHAHYFTNANGQGCRLNLADWQQSAEATAITGKTLTVPLAAAQPDSTYLAGIVEYNSQEYLIQSHVGDALTLDRVPEGLADAITAGTTNVLIAPGCNLTIENCAAFSNTDNFGGFNDMEDSAFDGRSIA